MVVLGDGNLYLRPLQLEDAPHLARLINNKKIWDNLRDYIPFPYAEKDAIEFIKLSSEQSPPATFGIIHSNELCGVIGMVLQKDIYRLSAEIGYWVGEKYWGQGIATKALRLLTSYGFDQLKLVRLYAGIFSHNEASKRVLEKCGYQLEGVAKNGAIKNNQILDEHKYAILKSGISNDQSLSSTNS